LDFINLSKDDPVDIIGVIPARYESSRFPGKPLADISGKPMIRHVYERSRQAEALSRVLVATDDRRIVDAVHAFGGEALLTSDAHPSGTDRIAEACRLLSISEDAIVVNIQGDEPLLEPVMIQRLVEALQDSDSPMATLVFESHDEREMLDPNVVKAVVDQKGRALYFSRAPIPHVRDRGGAPAAFLKHLGLYAYRHSFLQLFTRLPQGNLERIEKLEQLRALENGFSIRTAISPVETHGVDTPEDLAHILCLYNSR
jgi:3-deoxy-manno-octulosonate cytidylyltransferase (CMP-KDO synthetase)